MPIDQRQAMERLGVFAGSNGMLHECGCTREGKDPAGGRRYLVIGVAYTGTAVEFDAL